MTKLGRLLVIVLVLASFIISLPSHVLGVLIANDKIFLYQNGLRVTDSLTFYSGHPCISGVCDIQQGYNPYRFYRPKTTFYTIEGWYQMYNQNRPGCENVTFEEVQLGEVLDKDSNAQHLRQVWQEKGYKFNLNPTCKIYPSSGVAYRNYLESNSEIAISVSFPSSRGGWGCGYKNCLGGMIGTPRAFNLELVTGDYQEIINLSVVAKNTLSRILVGQISPWLLVMVAGLLITGVFLIFKLFTRRKEE